MALDYDESEDRLIIERVQDVEPILEANKRAFNDADTSWKREMNHVARIPKVIIDEYMKRGINLLADEAALKRFLNDPDNRLFRTKPGRV